MGAKMMVDLLGSERDVTMIRNDQCPDCEHYGLQGGPRGGASQNIFCAECGAGFNVCLPRLVISVERIGKRP